MNHLQFQKVERILALDLHPRSLGYAVLENENLLSGGLRKWKSGERKAASRKICRLLDLWQPFYLVIREGTPRVEYAMVARLARNAGLKIRTINSRMIQLSFPSPKRLSRFDIAQRIAERYPELALRVPAKRQLGHAEPFQVRMFNAIAVGMASTLQSYNSSSVAEAQLTSNQH
jgi:hypothetical protein